MYYNMFKTIRYNFEVQVTYLKDGSHLSNGNRGISQLSSTVEFLHTGACVNLVLLTYLLTSLNI